MATETIEKPTDLNIDGRHDQPKAEMKDAEKRKEDKPHQEGPQLDLKPIGTGKVILFGVIFVVLFALLFLVGRRPYMKQRELADADAKKATDDRPIVDVAMPRPPTKMPALELPGDAQAFQATAIYPRTNGYLTKRLVDIGDHVEAGQLLAEIATPEVDAQLASAMATLQQAAAATQRAQDDFDLADATYQRYQGFAKGGGVTQQQLDERKSAYTQGKSTLAGAQATQRSDEAEVQRLTALQSYEKVIAPFTGTITARNYDVGALLSDTNTTAGKEMFDIAETDILRVFVNVPQAYSTFVKPGQPAKFLVSNFPGRMFDGNIARTSGSIDQVTRTLRVEVDIPNAKDELFAGMYGYVHYEVQTPQKQLMIPSSALVFGADGMQVAMLDGSNKVTFAKIVLGRDLGTEVEVTEGLTTGDRIVANPGERLSNGIEVQITQKNDDASKTSTADTNAAPAKPNGEREAVAK